MSWVKFVLCFRRAFYRCHELISPTPPPGPHHDNFDLRGGGDYQHYILGNAVNLMKVSKFLNMFLSVRAEIVRYGRDHGRRSSEIADSQPVQYNRIELSLVLGDSEDSRTKADPLFIFKIDYN